MKRMVINGLLTTVLLSGLMVVPAHAQEGNQESEQIEAIESYSELTDETPDITTEMREILSVKEEVPEELIGKWQMQEPIEGAIEPLSFELTEDDVYIDYSGNQLHLTTITVSRKEDGTILYQMEWDVLRYEEEYETEVPGPQLLVYEQDPEDEDVLYDESGNAFYRQEDTSEPETSEESELESSEDTPEPETSEETELETSEDTPEPETSEEQLTVVPYETEYRDNNEQYVGYQVVIQEGVNGLVDADGKVVQEPVTQIIEVGTIPNVDLQVTTELVETDYEVTEKTDANLAQGQRIVKVKGEKGLVEVTYSQKTENGQLVGERQEMGRITLKNPVDEVVAVGTRVADIPINTNTPPTASQPTQTPAVQEAPEQATQGQLVDSGDLSLIGIGAALLSGGGWMTIKKRRKE